MLKKSLFFGISVFLSCFVTMQSMAATLASTSMHYGSAHLTHATNSGAASIVVTNCSGQMATVGAWFADSSSKSMTIYPAGNYPMNMISIDNSYPFVDISVTAMDGTTLFPYQPVYPGQQVNIGCGMKKIGARPVVTVNSH